jgi:flagellar motor protein MotB
MSDEHSEEINFWPAFGDSMLSVILVLLLVLGAVYLVLGQKIKKAEDCQQQFASGLLHVRRVSTSNVSGWEVFDPQTKQSIVSLRQDPHDKLLLHITFSESTLFADCDDSLGVKGQGVLREIGQEIRNQANSIVEIGILGHADSRHIKRSKFCQFDDNLHLASARADSVFLFLQNDVGISPTEHAMSATSYGEFFPANREIGKPYSDPQWEQANSTDELMQKNRRVELLLRYGAQMAGCSAVK